MLYDPGTKTIIYDEEDAQVAAPLAYASSPGYCAVHNTYQNLVLLNGMDLDVPDPMDEYEWPAAPGTEAWDTQCQVSSFMVLNPRSFVFSDLRTGKTRAALWAVDWLMATATRRLHCLVVSDINALEGTWANEITTHLLGRRTFEMLHHASAAKRVSACSREADFYLLNHDGLRLGRPKKIIERDERGHPVKSINIPPTGLYEALLAKRFDIIIFDEATTYREVGTETFKCALDLSRNASFVYLLTGTPTPNGPLDAYGLKRLCHPQHKLSFKSWRDAATVPDGPFRRNARPEAAGLVDELLQPSIRITQDQCFTPQPLTTLNLEVPLSVEQKEKMAELKRELTVMMDERTKIDAVNQAALRAKLIQISCGVIYDEDHRSHLVDATPRVTAFQELISKIPGKIIVFAPLTSVLQLLEKYLGSGCVLIANSLSKRKKLKLLRDWQASPTSRVLLSHPGPIARGVDLSMANVIIWYAPIDRTEYFLQANERINGVNQTRPRYIIRMSGCSIEAGIYERLESNASLLGVILKLKEMKLD